MQAPRIVLASGSPRRASMLRALDVAFRTLVTRVDETLAPGEGAAAAAERLARAKAQAAAAEGETLPVLAADTVVACEGQVLGKPATPAAADMLRLLSGRTHQVVTGVCVHSGGTSRSGVERSDVSFLTLTEDEIGWYVATGEPMDKAGAYHVEGRGALFVSAVSGSPSNVAGLPVTLVRRLLREAGVAVGWP